MERRLAVKAWGCIDELDGSNGERILALYTTRLDRGRENAP